MNKSNSRRLHLCVALAIATGVLSLPARATSIPPSSYVYDVNAAGNTQCSNSAQGSDGICDYTSPNGAAGGTAQTSGGIPGTAGYDGLSGTSVSAQAANGQVPVSGPDRGMPIKTVSVMDYFFTVTGPGNYIPITVISEGLAELTGKGYAYADLTIRDEGQNPASSGPYHGGTLVYSEQTGVHDFHGDEGNTLERSWNQSAGLCVTAGDYYLIQIVAVAYSTGAAGDSIATVDPKVKVDPPAPQDCPLDGPLSAYSLSVSAGASTGFAAAVPEPGTFVLAGLGLGLIGYARYATRRR